MTISADETSIDLGPAVLDTLEATAIHARGSESWEVSNDHTITDVRYSDQPRAFRPIKNIRRALKEVTGIGLQGWQRDMRDLVGNRWQMALTWLTFSDTNGPDAIVQSDGGRLRLIAYWDEDARHAAAFDPATALAMIAEIRRLRAEVEELSNQDPDIEVARLRAEVEDLTQQVVEAQLHDGGYAAGFHDGSTLADQYKSRAEALRDLLAEVDDAVASAEAFGDDLDPADITAITAKVDTEAAHAAA